MLWLLVLLLLLLFLHCVVSWPTFVRRRAASKFFEEEAEDSDDDDDEPGSEDPDDGRDLEGFIVATQDDSQPEPRSGPADTPASRSDSPLRASSLQPLGLNTDIGCAHSIANRL
eukprot:scaffold209945_cov31-Prasinocladus_malaysianus.AAC.1